MKNAWCVRWANRKNSCFIYNVINNKREITIYPFARIDKAIALVVTQQCGNAFVDTGNLASLEALARENVKHFNFNYWKHFIMKINSFCSSILYRIRLENIKFISLLFARLHDPRAERSEIPSQVQWRTANWKLIRLFARCCTIRITFNAICMGFPLIWKYSVRRTSFAVDGGWRHLLDFAQNEIVRISSFTWLVRMAATKFQTRNNYRR